MLMPLVYAGLAGTVLALIVATRQQNWSLRVLFLIGLRLAIGWHFLFEGLHKIHTHEIGPSETNKPFSSEMYFKVAPGPLGPYMRSKFETEGGTFEDKLRGAKELTPEQFAKMPFQHQAAMCPLPIAKEIDDLFISFQREIVAGIEADADAESKAAGAAEAKALAEADAAEQRAVKGQWTTEETERIRARATNEQQLAKQLGDGKREKTRSRNRAIQEAGGLLLARFIGMPAIVQPLQKELDQFRAASEKEIQAATDEEKKTVAESAATSQRWLSAKWTASDVDQFKKKAESDKKATKAKADAARAAAQEKRGKATITMIERKEAVKQKYAMWAYGVAPRDTKVKGIANEVPMTAPQRVAQIEFLRNRVKEEDDRVKAGLGNGHGIDQKKAAELRMDVMTAENDLKKDIVAFLLEIKKEFVGSAKLPEAPAPERTAGQKMDGFTMWFLVAIGGCIMGGFLTRIACVAGSGFLLLTYLTHPPFPWFPLPPNTEGNPVFINKNAIEGLALLVLATFPTGRWLGIDALIARCCGCGKNCEPQA